LKLSRGEWAVLAFNLVYIGGFFTYFTLIANREFIGYILTMLALLALVAVVHARVRFPVGILWGLSFWGLAHMAGGGVPVNGSVLYNAMLLPILGSGELRILKYDQIVHFYGFAVTAWLLWYLLASLFPAMRGSRSIVVFAALASMGLGAANEIVEFTAVMLIPNTNVGGYFNTALDLVFNALGAISAMLLRALVPGPATYGSVPSR
jgi:putative membrane protein